MAAQNLKKTIATGALGLALAASILLAGGSGSALAAGSAKTQTQKTTKTKEDYYSVAVSQSASEVEAFAQSVKDNFLASDWKALSKQIDYPVLVGKEKIQNKKAFIRYAKSGTVRKKFLKALKKETCKEMFCRDQGVCFGDGIIWFSERESGTKTKLRVISFSDFIKTEKTTSKDK